MEYSYIISRACFDDLSGYIDFKSYYCFEENGRELVEVELDAVNNAAMIIAEAILDWQEHTAEELDEAYDIYAEAYSEEEVDYFTEMLELDRLEA